MDWRVKGMWKLIRPDAYRVWNDSTVRERLLRYYEVFNNRLNAKFLIALKVGADVELEAESGKLWDAHDRTSGVFRGILKHVDRDEVKLEGIDSKISYLDLKVELARRILSECHFCERRCGANRLEDKKGFCKLGSQSYVSTAFLHTGEEAPLVPSGTNA
jgi:putative pyruvate formate lyase activating enzyme